jgi:hypothetical protein
MKSFADVKRRLQVGTKLKMVRNDWYPSGKLINLVREIEKVQTNAIMFAGGSWLYFPPATEVIIESENVFSFLLEPNVSTYNNVKITYEFVGD